MINSTPPEKGKQSSFDVVETGVDPQIEQATQEAKNTPRSKSNNFLTSELRISNFLRLITS